jgi:hypothetical protein
MPIARSRLGPLARRLSFFRGRSPGSTSPGTRAFSRAPVERDEVDEFLDGILARRGRETLSLHVAIAGTREPQSSSKKLAQRYPQLSMSEQILFLEKETERGKLTRRAVRFRIVGNASAFYR